MSEGKSDFKRLRRSLVEAVGDGPGEDRIQAQRREMVSLIAHRKRPRQIRLAWSAAAAAAVLLAVLLWIGLSTGEKNLGYSVGGNRVLVAGKSLESVDRPIAVDFDDGSRIEILEGSAGRLMKSTSVQVVFRLDSGKVSADVHHRKNATWSVEAGPYRVTVVGTEFAVSWIPTKKSLDVSVSRGRVLVTGPGLEPKGRRLVKGESLHIPGMTDEQPASPEKTVAEGGQSALSPGSESSPCVEETNPSEKTVTATGGIPAWKALFNDGKYAAAVEAAEKEGFERLLLTLDQGDLWSLSDACRYAREGRKAEDALMAVRSRFPTSGHAKIAAFLLGRVSMELNKDPAAAMKWFKTYLVEEPGAPLAEEAQGRLIKAGLAAGNVEEARKAAKTYIDKYPDGVFAPLAESALQ